MAIKLPSTSATIKVILRQDSAIEVSEENYEKYLETLDESLLTFIDGKQPTRFVLRKVLRADAAASVMNKQIKINDKKADVQMGFVIEEVRMALVDVENAPDCPEDEKIIYKRDSDGGASDELIAGLQAIGAVMTLWTARNNANQGTSAEGLKKK